MGPGSSSHQQTVTWDAKASRWETLPIPTWQGDPFLCMLDEEVEFRPDMTVLDIGCGSGVYGFAIAPRVRSVIGVDVSPKMIEAAERRAVVEGIDNVSFVTGDFLKAGAPRVVRSRVRPHDTCNSRRRDVQAHARPCE